MYKEMKMTDKLPTMSEAEALKLLSENGKLVKRPFVIGDKAHLVGFKEDEWKETF
ncbi:ArsC family protein [compost metagenome]